MLTRCSATVSTHFALWFSKEGTPSSYTGQENMFGRQRQMSVTEHLKGFSFLLLFV